MKHKIIVLACLLLFPCEGMSMHPKPSILVLHSYHPGFTWTNLVMKGISRGFEERRLSVEYYIEYMDAKRYTKNTIKSSFLNLLWRKIRNKKFSVVIVSDNAALNLALDVRPRFFPGVPVVFCGINGPPEHIIRGRKNVTGVTEKWDPAGTFYLLKKLQPAVRHILVLHDYSESGLGTRKNLSEVLPSFEKNYSFSFIPSEPVHKTLARIKKLPLDTVILLLGYNVDSENIIFDSAKTGAYFAEHTNVPVYTMDLTRFNSGVLGGSLLSGVKQGQVAAEMAAQIIAGVPIEQIPIIKNPMRHIMVDYAAMKKFNIPLSNLPSGSIVMNKPTSLCHRYFYSCLGVVILLTILIVLSGFLIVNRIIKKRVESELSRLVAILEATNDIITTTTMDKDIIYMNDAGKKMFGLDGEHISFAGKKISDLHPTWANRILETKTLASIRMHGIWSGETAIVAKNGKEIPVSQVVMIHSDRHGKSQYLSSIMRDISEQRKNQEVIRQSEENLRITLDSIGDAVITTDAHGLITRLNHTAEKITGWSMAEALAKNLPEVFKIVSSVSGEIIGNPVTQVIETQQPIYLSEKKCVLINRHGARRNISDSAAPIRNRDGIVVGVVLVFRDITDDLRIQEQLRQSQRMELIGQLAGGVAHDFNNILTVILGSAQLLSDSLPEKSEEQVLADDIISASLQASELTGHLLTFSRKGQMQMVPLHFHHIVDEVTRLLSRSIDKQITIVKNFNAQMDTILGDPVTLQSTVLNLAINSRDAILGQGTITFATENITLSREYGEEKGIPSGEYILFSVDDTGKGMNDDVKRRIFEPYFTTKPSGKGTGLGLAAVYGCIQGHNGSIQVYSEPGKGSSFHVFLPVESTAVSIQQLYGDSNIKHGEGSVIIIDDEDILRNTAAKILSRLGYTVQSFDNGYEAVAYYKEHYKFTDLIILDLIMPQVSGYDTFFMLKDINPGVKVLLSSGFIQHSKIDSLLESGAMGFINKPYRIAQLSNKVWECIYS